ncbi:MAG TPA: inorganic diphosphatase [Candidatus Saccharimonadales bacterium]|nr:inorganic diphosphatase [Candidatus Saccharimonadales bacterium]
MTSKTDPTAAADSGALDRVAADRSGPARARPSEERPVGIFHESAGAAVIVGGRCVALRRGEEWVLPKGHLELGEQPQDAALREIREETGLEIRLVRPLGVTRYTFGSSGGATNRKRVHWFLAEQIGGALRPGEPFSEAALLDPDEAALTLSHEADRRIAASAFAAAAGRGEAAEVLADPLRSPEGPAAAQDDAFPNVVEMVVEIPRGSRNKYEWDEATGVIRLDRVLSSSVYYNVDYGFVTDTRADDGDHTDALLLLDGSIFPGCHVTARPIGGLEMTDEHGFDFKTLCVAVGDPLYSHLRQLSQVEPHRLREIENFFATYKLLENTSVDIVGWRDLERAREVLLEDRARWLSEGR